MSTKIRITVSPRDDSVGYWWVVSVDEVTKLVAAYADEEVTWILPPIVYSAENVRVRGIMEHFFNAARIPAIEAHTDLVVKLEVVPDPVKDDPCQIPLLPQSLN